jgi:mycothiol system anti-sigma-R factor
VSDEPGCSESLHELYTFLDGELTVDRRVAIEHHLDGCSPCGERYDFEAELRIVIKERCREQVPDALKARVLAAIRDLQGGQSV